METPWNKDYRVYRVVQLYFVPPIQSSQHKGPSVSFAPDVGLIGIGSLGGLVGIQPALLLSMLKHARNFISFTGTDIWMPHIN
jgi:hypothetical protein